MGNIKLLDCTLRDGGYINDWKFGIDAITDTVEKISNSGVDIFEIGFLKDEDYIKNRTVFNNMSQINDLIKPKNMNIQYAAMIEVLNPIPIEKLEICSENTVDIIRVIVWKRLLKEGFEYCKEIIKKGYKLCVQPARVEQYSYEEFENMLNLFAEINPMAIYVVDSFGTQTIDTLLPYFKLIDSKLSSNIALGYHGHNNLMQAMEAAQVFVDTQWNRDIIVDASIYGMGRGAGNLNIELIAKYLNDNKNKSYKIENFLEIFDKYLKPIYNYCPWGYSLPYYLTASYGCNPNYASYYDWELKLRSEDIKGILETLSNEEKIVYTKQNADNALCRYRKKKII